MSLSTTSTAIYSLTKYSRAYPSQTNASETDAEWQHYTNPVIQLVLDIKKSASGELEAYRVRVLWQLNTGPETMEVDQREVVFEDIDLLSFSSPSTLETQRHNFAVHGLPLKAVYRDSVVGIRYMHPRMIGQDTTPTYRRFQMNFQKAMDATSFVDAIKHVCPCKPNTPASGPAMPPRSVTMATMSTNTSASSQMPPPKIPARSMKPLVRSSTAQSPCVPASSVLTKEPLSSRGVRPSTIDPPLTSLGADPLVLEGRHLVPDFDSSASTQASLCALPRIPSVSSLIPQKRGPPSQEDSSYTDISESQTKQLTLSSSSLADSVTAVPLSTPTALHPPALSVPRDLVSYVATAEVPPQARLMASSLPGSSQHTLTPPQDASSSPGTSTADFVKSLREQPILYKLPREDLENLVAQVVREDGFLQLLESLDSMWRVKGFVGIES